MMPVYMRSILLPTRCSGVTTQSRFQLLSPRAPLVDGQQLPIDIHTVFLEDLFDPRSDSLQGARTVSTHGADAMKEARDTYVEVVRSKRQYSRSSAGEADTQQSRMGLWGQGCEDLWKTRDLP